MPYTVIERLPKSSKEALSDLLRIMHRSLAAEQPMQFNRRYSRFIVLPRVFPERLVKLAVGGKVQFVHDIVRGVQRLPSGELDWDDLMVKLKAKRAERKRNPLVCYTEVTILSGDWCIENLKAMHWKLADVRIFGGEDDPKLFALLGHFRKNQVVPGIHDEVEFKVDLVWTAKSPEEKFGPELQREGERKLPRERSQGFTVVMLIGGNTWDVFLEKCKELPRFEIEFRPEHPRHLVITGRHPAEDVDCFVRKATSLDGTSFCISTLSSMDSDEVFESIVSPLRTKVHK